MRSYPIPIHLLLLLTLAGPALAVDGVLEINETCAVQTGCFPGDAPKYPVTIKVSGSYRLTGNLQVPDENTTAIELGSDADHSSIDLNGFTILGSTICVGSNCSPLGTGHRIAASKTITTDITVRNGRVIGAANPKDSPARRGRAGPVAASESAGFARQAGPNPCWSTAAEVESPASMRKTNSPMQQVIPAS